jgi:TrmH family RNA methyltransferase
MIESPSNPRLKDIRRLRSAAERRRQGRFFVEGPRLVLGALDAGAPVEQLLLAPALCRSVAVTERLAAIAAEAQGPPVLQLSSAAFTALSERDGPTGIGAVVARRDRRLADLPADEGALVVAALDLADPGNLGSLLRTMDAVRASALVLCGVEGTEPEHPTAAKASMGALFRVPTARATVEELLTWAGTRGLTVVASSAHAAEAHWDRGSLDDLASASVLLLLGSEKQGLPEALLERADRRVRIPMAGSGTSLNVSVAAGILLYELRRGRLP